MKLEQKWQVLAIICIGIFMSTLDGSILNIANPTIARDLAVDIKDIQWVVTAYMLVITASLLFFGKLGDARGNHKIYTYGFLIFTLGSFFCSLAASLPILIAARVFQAFGASMMMATGIGIISNTFPASERGKALGFTGSMVGIGNMTGPALGGLLVANFSWPIIFIINIPIGLIAFYLAYRRLPIQPVLDHKPVYDLPGTLFLGMSATMLVISLSSGDTVNPGLLFTGMLLMVLFYLLERKTPHPMLDFTLFKIKHFVYGNIMGFLAYVTQNFVFFLMPFYLERLLHFSPSYSGLMMTIPPVCMAITAPLAGTLSDKIGPVRLTSVSFVLLTCAHFLFSLLDSASALYHIIAGLALFGIGMGCFGSPNNSSILGATPREKAGYTGGFISTNRNFAFSVGIAASASLFSFFLMHYQQQYSYAAAYGMANAWVYRISAAIALTGLLISLLTANDRRPAKEISSPAGDEV